MRCYGRHSRVNNAIAAVDRKVDETERIILRHDRRLVTLAGEDGKDGAVGELYRRIGGASRWSLSLLICGISIVGAVIGAWMTLSSRMAAMEARQQILIETVDRTR